jgi:hypothetical protein
MFAIRCPYTLTAKRLSPEAEYIRFARIQPMAAPPWGEAVSCAVGLGLVPGRCARCVEVRILDGLAYYSVAIGGGSEAVGREMKCATVGLPKLLVARCCKDLDHDGGRTAPCLGDLEGARQAKA